MLSGAELEQAVALLKIRRDNNLARPRTMIGNYCLGCGASVASAGFLCEPCEKLRAAGHLVLN